MRRRGCTAVQYIRQALKLVPLPLSWDVSFSLPPAGLRHIAKQVIGISFRVTCSIRQRCHDELARCLCTYCAFTPGLERAYLWR